MYFYVVHFVVVEIYNSFIYNSFIYDPFIYNPFIYYTFIYYTISNTLIYYTLLYASTILFSMLLLYSSLCFYYTSSILLFVLAVTIYQSLAKPSRHSIHRTVSSEDLCPFIVVPSEILHPVKIKIGLKFVDRI